MWDVARNIKRDPNTCRLERVAEGMEKRKARPAGKSTFTRSTGIAKCPRFIDREFLMGEFLPRSPVLQFKSDFGFD